MANTFFDAKAFNPEAFGKYVESIPNVKRSELAKSGAVGANQNARNALATQTGSLYARIPYVGRISADTSQNNDGATNIQSSKLGTFEQGFVTASRMDSWTERDFSANITAGTNFLDEVGKQIADYKLQVKQVMLLKILKGIFNLKTNWADNPVANAAAQDFKDKHTYDITGKAGMDAYVGAGTLNSAIQKACGDNKDIFKLTIMHSEVATNLENLRLLSYLTYTDPDGITRTLTIGNWNGRLVLVDDDMPVKFVASTAGVYTVTIGGSNASEGDKFVIDGDEYTVASADTKTPTGVATSLATALGSNTHYSVSRDGAVLTLTEKSGQYGYGQPVVSTTSTATTITAATGTAPTGYNAYTTYALGQNSINLDPIGDVTPYEMARAAATNGGETSLFVRDRFIVGASGISFEKPSSITASAANSDLEDGDNWMIVNNGTIAIPHKSIALAQIISKG